MWKLRCSRCNDLLGFVRQTRTPVALILRAWLGETLTGYTGPADTAACVSCAEELGAELAPFLLESLAPS